MPRFDRRALVGVLLPGVPPVLALAAVLLAGGPVPFWQWALLALAGLLMAGLARWQYRRIVFPLYSLSGLITALREGDYSLRGVHGSVLGDLVADINALADRLQRERVEFEESAHLLAKTLAALDSAVLVFDQDRRLRLLNPAAQALLDSAEQRLFGRSAVELGLAGLLDGPPSQVLTHRFPARSGRFEIRCQALRRDGRDGTLLVINDVGRVLREEERQAWQRLLRVLGHEVNNSLAPIQSMAGTLATLLAREPMPDDWREDFHGGLALIGNRASALARFLAGYSRLARLPPPRMAAVDLRDVLYKIAALEQRVPVELEDGGPLAVQADADQLEQAVINLLRNAAEASLPRHGSVRLRWRREHERAVIEIEDAGAGPPPSDNLFVPYFTTKPGGSGIGLTLARQIAEAHDGGVSLRARTDAPGAIAQLWLPRAMP
ncbi:MAG TPA: ATP-binding protein [Rhodanobacteraceae bacterium]|nr:ATP-binding protein [Rhodanobacteraceae bacterium]